MDGRVRRKTFAELMAEAALQGMPEDRTTADLLNVPLSRGAILPLTEYLDRAEFDLSSGLPGAFADAVTAPARAARGEITEDQQIPEAFNFAGSLTLGNLLSGAAAPVKARAMSAYKAMGPEDAPADALKIERFAGRDRFMIGPDDARDLDAFANHRTRPGYGDELLETLQGRGMGPANSNSATAELFANAKTGAAVPLATRALEAQQPQGIRAFHGSPHDFDRFSMDAIGSGEGAQAYGHGLYFAEAEDVARSYKHSTTAKTSDVLLDGKSIGQNRKDYFSALDKLEADGNWPLAQAIKEVDALATSGTMPLDAVFRDRRAWHASSHKMLAALDEAEKRLSIKPRSDGHMYEVNIKADPKSFIDYDRPLGQQSEAVRRALDEAGLMPYTVVDQAGNRLDFSRGMPKAEAERFAAAKGGRAIPKDDADFDAVRKAQMMTGRGDAAQADIATALRDAGIPGVRYLDQMSRGAGEGSSNYVVFDDAIIDIVRKYGIAGLALLQAAGYGTNEGEETQ